jgi:hypothetical protein
MKTKHLALALGLGLLASTGYAQLTVDGVVDAAYGAPLATDDVLPTAGEGGGDATPILDLANLYVGNDATHLYVAITVAGDIAVTNWGKYIILINSPGIAGTTTGAVWVRADSSVSNYQVSSWVDSGGGTEFDKWNGSAWADSTGNAAIGNTSVPGVVEARIPLSELGNPSSITIAAYSTGGGATDPAIDALPGANGNSNWATPTTLTTFAPYTIGSSVEDWCLY